MRRTRLPPARLLTAGPLVARLLTAGLLAGAALGACGGSEGGAGQDGRLDVVVTTSILGDVVRAVTGPDTDRVRVTVLMGDGVDPHDFAPSARDADAVRRADLVVANGGGLESGLHDTLDDAAGAGVEVFEALGSIDALPFGGHAGEPTGEEGDAGSGGHDHGDVDPHFWQDPSRMATAVTALGTALDTAGRRAGVDAPGFAAAAATYAAELRALDGEVAALVGAVPVASRTLVTDHDAFGYFAARYGFAVVGTVIPAGTTLAAPSAKDLAALAEVIRDAGVRAIFTENTMPADLAEALAGEVGGDVAVVGLYSDALGAAGSGADTYVGLVRTNARLITEALA